MRLAGPLLRRLAAEPASPWLEVGCGAGTMAREMLALDARQSPLTGPAVGIDVAPGMLAEAGRSCPELRRVRGDATRLPFPRHAFDRVLAPFMLHHVREQRRALSEMLRVLRPGGRLGVLTWGREDPGCPAFDAWEACLQAAGAPADDPAPPPNWMEGIDSPAALAGRLQGCGFEQVETWLETARVEMDATTLAAYCGSLGGRARRLETLPPDRQARCRAAGLAALNRLSAADLAWHPPVVVALCRAGTDPGGESSGEPD